MSPSCRLQARSFQFILHVSSPQLPLCPVGTEAIWQPVSHFGGAFYTCGTPRPGTRLLRGCPSASSHPRSPMRPVWVLGASVPPLALKYQDRIIPVACFGASRVQPGVVGGTMWSMKAVPFLAPPGHPPAFGGTLNVQRVALVSFCPCGVL